MELLFVRHAEKEEGGLDTPLTRKGLHQARLLAQRLKCRTIDAVYCSPLLRAQQTTRAFHRTPHIEPGLAEFESSMLKKPKRIWSKLEQTHYRALRAFLKRITHQPDDSRTVLIIAHGITNRIILSYLCGVPLRKAISFTQSETGVNEVYWMSKFKNWRLRYWNDDGHLPKRLKGNAHY